MDTNIVLALLVSAVFLVIGVIIGNFLGKASQKQAAAQALSELQLEAQSYKSQMEATAQQTQQQAEYLKQQLMQAQQARDEAQHAHEIYVQQQMQNQTKAEQQTSRVLQAFAPVQTNLRALQDKINEVENGRKTEMGSLATQLAGLKKQQEDLHATTNSLSQVLNNNQVRGAWGEAQLKNIVESAGLLEHVDFDTQVATGAGTGGGAGVAAGVGNAGSAAASHMASSVSTMGGLGSQHTKRPDMVIYLPGNKAIPVDSKAPYNDFMRASQISGTASELELSARADLLKKHAQALKKHIDTLASKAYWEAFDQSPEFVIAFIPNEALLRAALEADPTLLDYAFSKRVALTSPVSLWSVLKSVAFAWQQQQITSDMKDILKTAQDLYKRISTLGSRTTKLGKSIVSTVRDYNSLVTSMEGRQGILPTARKLSAVELSQTIDEVHELDSAATDVKALTSAELSTPEQPS